MSGFTLTEMIVVVSIVAILMAIGVPTYRSVTNSNRIAAEVNGLLGDMQYARAEAIKEGQPVTVCTSSDGATCANVATWQSGWIVFSNPNANTTVDPGEAIFRVQRPFSGSDTFQASGSTTAVTFNREGFMQAPTTAVTITLHDSTSNSAWTRCLAITKVGMLATQTTSIAGCT
jgi:type IV fimbrial biogenesis protein FimT